MQGDERTSGDQSTSQGDTQTSVQRAIAEARAVIQDVTTELYEELDRVERLVQEVIAAAQREATALQGRLGEEVDAIRARAQADADALRAQAEEELGTLRVTVDDELQSLRTEAEEEVQRLRAQAEEEARALRGQAEEEARALRAAVEEELEAMRASAQTQMSEQRAQSDERLRAAQIEMQSIEAALASAVKALAGATGLLHPGEPPAATTAPSPTAGVAPESQSAAANTPISQQDTGEVTWVAEDADAPLTAALAAAGSGSAPAAGLAPASEADLPVAEQELREESTLEDVRPLARALAVPDAEEPLPPETTTVISDEYEDADLVTQAEAHLRAGGIPAALHVFRTVGRYPDQIGPAITRLTELLHDAEYTAYHNEIRQLLADAYLAQGDHDRANLMRSRLGG